MSDDKHEFDRRSFIGAATGAALVGASAAAGLMSASAQAQPPAGGPPGGGGGGFAPMGYEVTVRNCDIEGEIPSDLNGGFYATGPDPQYPQAPGNIIFDGEGHVRLFRIKNGRVDYLSRYAKSERYMAQDAAGRALMPMYRNPSMDDPSVAGLSRSTANTHVMNHQNLILSLKEESPPVAMDLETLETINPVYTFDGELPRNQPFTAHPKICSVTGNMVAFGYEAKGFGSDIVNVFELEKGTGKKIWSVDVQVPYVSVMHDFAVTENHILLYVVPLAIDHEQMSRGGIHWSWDKDKKTYLGFMRRFGDGTDIQWIEGPSRSGTHTMGAFEDDGRIYFDTEITAGNPFPFMPNRDGSPPDFANNTSYINRLSFNINRRNRGYDIEQMYPLVAPLPRQDDRYNTMPYRYGYMATSDPEGNPGSCFGRVDNATRSYTLWNAGPGISLAEPVFAPKSPGSPEGVGYLMGVAYHVNEGNRGDLVILDAERLDEGPIATVKLPTPASPQVHGWWVREDQYPT